jgi:hypothetical protein
MALHARGFGPGLFRDTAIGALPFSGLRVFRQLELVTACTS